MSDIQGEKAWYAVHTYSGYEKKVESNLKKRIETMNMEDYIFQCIVPVEKLIEDRNGKPKQVERKIFPGYVLVEMILNDESWLFAYEILRREKPSALNKCNDWKNIKNSNISFIAPDFI